MSTDANRGFQSEIKNKMTTIVGPDKMVSSGSALFAKVFVLVCRDERVKTLSGHSQFIEH